MKDVQNYPGEHNIDIDQVGVSDLKYPVTVLDKVNNKQSTVATVSLSVDLPHHFKGTHMSRFVQILNKHHDEITIRNMGEILMEMAEKLEAESAHMDMSFTYFVKKSAPVSGETGLMDYPCRFLGSYYNNDENDFILEVKVPIQTLCPCSKEISDYGAHNQRSEVTVQLRFKDFVWIEDIINIVENSASVELYPLLKRPDEKYVTEHAYNNPRFVEDIVRIVADKLNKDNNITWYIVKSVNFESIHNHNAYAIIKKDKRNNNK